MGSVGKGVGGQRCSRTGSGFPSHQPTPLTRMVVTATLHIPKVCVLQPHQEQTPSGYTTLAHSSHLIGVLLRQRDSVLRGGCSRPAQFWEPLLVPGPQWACPVQTVMADDLLPFPQGTISEGTWAILPMRTSQEALSQTMPSLQALFQQQHAVLTSAAHIPIAACY